MGYHLGQFNLKPTLDYRKSLEGFLEQFPDGFLVERGHKEENSAYIPTQTQGALPIIKDFELDKAPFKKPNLISRVYHLSKRKNGDNNVNGFWKGVTIGRGENNDISLKLDTISKFQAYFFTKTIDEEEYTMLVDCGSDNTRVGVFVPKTQDSITRYKQVHLPKNQQVKLVDKCIILLGGKEGFAFQYFIPESFYGFLNDFDFQG